MNTPQEVKDLVRRLVDEVINGGAMDAMDEFFVPELAGRMKRLFGSFRSAFPDWHEEIVELVAEGNTVAGRFRCSGTHLGMFLGQRPTGKRMEVDEPSTTGVLTWLVMTWISRWRRPGRSG